MSLRARTARRRPLGLAAALAAACLLPVGAMAQEADASAPAKEGWDWMAAPYLWASSISADVGTDTPAVESEAEFSDLLSKIDMAFQGHVEGQGDRFGMFADLTYLALSDSKEHPVYTADTSLDTTIVELAGVWNVEPERMQGVDLFAGVRHIIVNADLKLDPVNPALSPVEIKLDQSFSDFMVGARYNATLSERWGLTFRVDGAWGDTDGTFNASALARYRMGNGSFVFGYRYMTIDIAKDGTDASLTLAGPILAYSFGF